MTLHTDDDARKAARAGEANLILASAMLPLALRRLDDHTGGYPASASGANTGGGGQRTIAVDDDPVPVTDVEAAALTPTTDRAVSDRRLVLQLLDRIHADSRDLVKLVRNYHSGTVTVHEAITLRLDKNAGDWCPNTAHGSPEPRAAARVHCRYCDDFKRVEGGLPDRELLDIRGRRNVLDRDVQEWRKRRKAKKGKAA